MDRKEKKIYNADARMCQPLHKVYREYTKCVYSFFLLKFNR